MCQKLSEQQGKKIVQVTTDQFQNNNGLKICKTLAPHSTLSSNRIKVIRCKNKNNKSEKSNPLSSKAADWKAKGELQGDAPPPNLHTMQIFETLKTKGFVSKNSNFQHSIVKNRETKDGGGGRKLEKCPEMFEKSSYTEVNNSGFFEYLWKKPNRNE